MHQAWKNDEDVLTKPPIEAKTVADSISAPRVAILERMRWGRISEEPFHLISDMETTQFCKPQEEYYLEIAGALSIRPEKCLMVGNDSSHDMAAKEVGMKTFLASTHRVDRGGAVTAPDATGDLKQLGRLLGFW